MPKRTHDQIAQKCAKGNTGPLAPKGRFRSFCFADFRQHPTEFSDKMDYLCYAPEICPTTNRHHWQTYVHFTNGHTISAAAKLVGCGVEVAYGTPTENRQYIFGPYTKDDKVKPENKEAVEFGELPQQGDRTDVTTIYTDVANGLSTKEILQQHGMKAMRMLSAIEQTRHILMEEQRKWPMDVRIYWGATGVGKTRIAYDEFGYDNVYKKMKGKWWDGYRGQHCVVIDELDPYEQDDYKFNYYLELLDRYPMRIEWKNGSGEFYSKVIILTSNYDPDEWWKGKPNRAAFFRRVTMIKHIEE